MILDEIKRFSTVGHEIIDYDEGAKVLVAKITFPDDYDIKEYMKWICYYIFGIAKSKFTGQRKLSDATYDIIFKMINEEFRPNLVVASEKYEGRYELEYDICLHGIDNLKFAIEMLQQEKMLKDRQLFATKEEKEAISVVIDILNLVEYLSKLYEQDKMAEHLRRLEMMALDAKSKKSWRK